MAPRLFSPDMEAMLLEQYEDIWVKANGSTLRAAEKYALIDTQINDVGKKKDWQAVTGSTFNVQAKVDTLRRKGRSVYKSLRRRTRTGAPVPADFDLDVRLCCDRLKIAEYKLTQR